MPEKANEQHYEVPAGFFAAVLGPRMKYSSCYWPAGVDTLAAAEESMLELTCERAGLADGQRILELGCGWGSLTLWMAERYPSSEIVAVSNSASQREFIESRAARSGLDNVTIVTTDMNDFEPDGPVRSRSLDRDVRAHAKPHGAPRPHRHLAAPLRSPVSPRLLPPALRLLLRDRRASRLDGALLLHRRHDALAGSLLAPAGAVRRDELMAGERPPLPAHRGGVAQAPGRTARARRTELARHLRQRDRTRGFSAGGCSSWPARSSSATGTARSGWSGTTFYHPERRCRRESGSHRYSSALRSP